MKLHEVSESPFLSQTACMLVFFLLHFAFYSFNLRAPASLLSPISFAFHLFNISFSLQENECRLLLVKRKSLSKICALAILILALFLGTFRVISRVLSNKFPPNMISEALMTTAFATAQLFFLCWVRSPTPKDLVLKNQDLHRVGRVLKTWSRAVDFSIVLVCFLLILFTIMTFTHFLTLSIVMLLMLLEDFKRWVPNLDFVRFEVYRFCLGFVTGLLLINFFVCFFLNRASVSKGLPLIVLLLFFKFKEVILYFKIWTEKQIGMFYQNVASKRSQVISSYLKDGSGPLTHTDQGGDSKSAGFGNSKKASKSLFVLS